MKNVGVSHSSIVGIEVNAEQFRRHHALDGAFPRPVRTGEPQQAGNVHGQAILTRVPTGRFKGLPVALTKVRVPSAKTS